MMMNKQTKKNTQILDSFVGPKNNGREDMLHLLSFLIENYHDFGRLKDEFDKNECPSSLFIKIYFGGSKMSPKRLKNSCFLDDKQHK
jgi:hypothetical protein